MKPTTWSIAPLLESFISSYNPDSLPLIDTSRNLTQLMMDMTDGVGCAENEHFSSTPEKAFCCEIDQRDRCVKYTKVKKMPSAPNVCITGTTFSNKMAPIPGCMCNEGLDLNDRENPCLA